MGELAGWLVAAGSAMAALGFVLPWSVAVIGARGYGGYLDGWGLASPTHVIALAVVLLTLALGVVKTTVPAWLRTGVLGLALGGLLIGLTWPYAIGPLGAGIGAMLATLRRTRPGDRWRSRDLVRPSRRRRTARLTGTSGGGPRAPLLHFAERFGAIPESR